MHGTTTPPRRKSTWQQTTIFIACLVAVTLCAILDSLWALPVVIVITIGLAAVGMSNNGQGFDAFIWSPWTYKTLEGGDEIASRDR